MEHDPVGQSRGGIILTRATLPRRLDRSGVTMGVTAGVEQNGTQTEGGCTKNSVGGVVHLVYHLVYHTIPTVGGVAPV